VNIYTPGETADILKVKPVTVIRLFDSGALPGIIVREGARKRIIRFRAEAIAKFLASREKRAGK
jgi:predicted site-specific integrase-resolvase